MSLTAFQSAAELRIAFVETPSQDPDREVRTVTVNAPRTARICGKALLPSKRSDKFLAGAGLVLDLGGTSIRAEISKQPERDDARALAGDWRRVGTYLRRAGKRATRR